MELLKTGTQVVTKRGDGVIIDIDIETYSIPMYTVLLINGKYTDESIYIADPRITPKSPRTTLNPSEEEIREFRAELKFDTMRDLITGVVTCRQCRTQYNSATETEIVDVETGNPAFYCIKCGGML